MARSRSKKKSKGIFIVLGVIAIILATLVIGFTMFMNSNSKPMDPNDTSNIIVEIPEGVGTSQIADILIENDLIRNKTTFKIQSKLKGYDGKYQAGFYALSRSMSMQDIMDILIQGRTAGQVFQVIEGQTVLKVADQLSEAGIVDKDEFLWEAEYGEFDYDFIQYLPEGPERFEGFLYPNSYQVPLDCTAHDVIDIMLKGFDDAMKADDLYTEISSQGRDMYEVIVEASIVEREASENSEKPLVASVIENRLAISMPLQMDSIISYILGEDKIRATYDDIAVDSEYNPYTNLGLPPGPICSPGIDAIKAVLFHDDTDYLYFVASPELDGTNVYSSTYDQFLIDKAKFDEAYIKYIQEHPGEE